MKRRLGPVYSFLCHLIQQHQKTEMSRDSPSKSLVLQIDDHKAVTFLCAWLLKFYTFYHTKTAIAIQASPQQFQLGCSNQLKNPGIFNNTCKLNHNTCRKSLTVSGSVRFAEWAHTKHVPLVQHFSSQIPCIKQGMLTGKACREIWQP